MEKNKKIDWKWRYEELYRLFLYQSDELKKSYATHIKTLNEWKNSLKINLFFLLAILIGGINLGLMIAQVF